MPIVWDKLISLSWKLVHLCLSRWKDHKWHQNYENFNFWTFCDVIRPQNVLIWPYSITYQLKTLRYWVSVSIPLSMQETQPAYIIFHLCVIFGHFVTSEIPRNVLNCPRNKQNFHWKWEMLKKGWSFETRKLKRKSESYNVLNPLSF